MTTIIVETLVILLLINYVISGDVTDFKFTEICRSITWPEGFQMDVYQTTGPSYMECAVECTKKEDCHYISVKPSLDGGATCIHFRPYIFCGPPTTLTDSWVTYERLGECSCQPGWTNFDRTCYAVNDTSQTWLDSEAFCNTQNSTLASVTSAAENNFVRQLPDSLGFGNGIVWLGASDSVSEGDWQWLTGEPWVVEFFPNIEPDGGTVENALALWWQGGWFDDRLSSSYYFVCEKACRLS